MAEKSIEKNGEEDSGTIFQDYEYIWSPRRPPKSKEEVAALTEGVSAETLIRSITFEDRIAMRSLLYTVIQNTNFRNILDGFLVPPPFVAADISRKRWSNAEVDIIVRLLPPSLDRVVVLIPFNLAIRSGSYDARLRAASRRLCQVLSIPFSVVEQQELSLEQAWQTMTAETGTGELQEEVLKGKDAQKSSLKRVATIGGFALLGGTALVLTGGLAAPLVGPAFAALVTATTATLGAIGSVGGAILGGGAIAAAFAAIVGVATHTAALLSIFTPVLTAANVTAVFGVSGVALGGYKGFRRTKDSDIFMIRSVDEVETFKDAVNPQGDEDALGTLSKLNQAIVEDDVGMLDIPSMLEDSSRPGITVPSHTRFTAMSHTRNIKTLKKRFRSIVFAVDCQIDDFELHLTAIKLISGVWTVIPPTTIKNSQSGIFACMNRFAHPTGTGFIVCYTATPTTKTSISRPVRVWLRVNQDFVGGLELSAFCEGINHELNPFAAEFWLESHVHDKEFTQTVSGLTLEVHAKPFSYLKVYASELKQRSSARQVTFPIPEFPQKLIEYNAAAKQRRKISVSVLNRSQHSILVRDLGVYNGNQWSETSSPMRIQPGEASLTLFTNASWSLEGAEGYYIFELLNDGANPVRPRYFIRLQFEVSALNNVNLMLVGAPTFRELKQMEELHPEPPQANEFEAPLMNGLFFSVSVRVTQSPNSIQLHVKDFVERTTERVQEKASLTVGVCGYSTIFDPRRPMQDQQVGLWQSPLRSSALLGVTEGYVVHWEDEFLMKFGETIKVDLQVSDQISKKAVKTVKKAATKKLLQGALFSGFHAFKSFMGAFSLPLYGVWAADLIDNNYATLVNRADFTGKDLAASLLDPNRGNRPVTLIGYSFGCRVIAECLVELDRLKAYGIVENAYLMGATFAADSEYWAVLRRVVAGRLVNVFTRGDFVLWLLYKVNEGDLKPMGGVTPINVPGVENVDASPIVSQHSEYAVKIQDVLDYIPFFPTADTWKPKTKYGSPGIVVSLKDTKDTVKKVGLSLVSVLSTTPYCSFGIRNMVLSDDVHFNAGLTFEASVLFHCFFDFLPPDTTECGLGGCFGVVGEGESEIAGALVFRQSLAPYASKDIVFIVFFYDNTTDSPLTLVQPHFLKPVAPEEEGEDDPIHLFVSSVARSLSDVKKLCMEGEKQPPTTQVALTFDTSPFHDGHKKSVLHLTVDKVGKGGVVVNVTCLLLKGSSQLQQESFSKELFTKQFKPSHHNASVIAESESHFNEQSPMENLQTSLNTYAPTLLPNEIPVVFVNCSDTNLYLGTGEAGDVTSTAEWHKQPLPKLDKNTFVVATLRTSGEVLSFPSVRYESADRKCMFTTVADETGKITTMCSNKAKGEVAVSSVSVAEHNFYLIMMTVTAPTFNDDDLQKDDVKLALQEHGWYIL